MSGGWLSGVCYPALVFTTVIIGFRYVFVRVPWQRAYLAIFAAFLGTVGESFVIDTDHWRHFWMMLGAMWGMFAAAQRYQDQVWCRLLLQLAAGRFSGGVSSRPFSASSRRKHGLVALVMKRSSSFSSSSE